MLGATLKAGESVTHEVGANRHAYLVPAVGRIEIDGDARSMTRDGAALTSGKTYTITAIQDAELVLVDSADIIRGKGSPSCRRSSFSITRPMATREDG